MASIDQPNRNPARVPSPVAGWVKPLVFVLVVGVILLLGYFGAASLLAPSDSSADDKLLTYSVAKGDLQVTVREDGNLESANNVDVKCEVAGGSTIISILPDGSFVQQGDLVVELDKSTLIDSINQQRNTYEKARATVIQAEQNFEVSKISIEEYEKGTFKQSQQDAEAQIKIAMENLRNSQNALAHAQRMFRKGYVSKLELETQEFAVQRAQLELDSAETARDVLVNYTKVKTLEDLKAQRDIAEAQLKSELAAFELEESKLTRLEEQLMKCEIRAPADGMVVYSNSEGGRFGGSQGVTIEEGAAVRERQSIFKLPDLSQMQVKVNVHETKIDQLERGMPALIRIKDKEWQGTVESIANQPEPTSRWAGNVKEYSTIVRVAGETSGLRPGMTAEVEILVAQLSDVVVVPVSTIVDAGVQHYCWVRTGGKNEKREVQIGLNDGSDVQVKSGLEVGEIVLRNPRTDVDEAKEVSGDDEGDSAKNFGERREMPQLGPGAERGSGARGGDERGAGGEGARGNRGGDRGADAGGQAGGFDANRIIEMAMQNDSDNDGKLSKEEAPEQMKATFDSQDTNGDGFVDRAEMKEAFSKWQPN